MGLFDDAVPGGNIAKPLLVALGVLLAGRMFSKSADRDEPEDEPLRDARERPTQIPDRSSPQIDPNWQREPAPQRRPAEQLQPQGTGSGGGILDGLGDLLDRMAQQGKGETADSWVKPDTTNKPIKPNDLGDAIGDVTLKDLARRTGMSEQELLEQLAKVLPGVVDKLTPQGQVPSNRDVARQFPNSPW